MSPLGKVGDKVTAAMALILLFGCMIFTLAGIGLTGMAPIFGEVGERTAEVAMRDSLPAVRAIVEPAGRVLWNEGGRAVKSLLPEGAVSLGPITIDPIWKNGGSPDGESPAGSSEEGGGAPSEGSSTGPIASPTPTPCVVNTTESRTALEAWKLGQWETAVANMNLTQANDCLAIGLATDYMEPFETAFIALQNAENEAQIKAAAETTKRLNPAYPGSYSALAFVEANEWLIAKPLDVTKAHLLAGAMARIANADMSWWCGQHTSLCQTEGDQFDVAIDFGHGWVATYLFSRTELEQIETALQLTSGALTTVGNSVGIPGSLLPNPLPAVPAPAPEQYAAPTPPPLPTTGPLCPAGKDVSGLVIYDISLPEWQTADTFPVGAQTIGGGVGSDPATTLCHTTHYLPSGEMGFVANRDLR